MTITKKYDVHITLHERKLVDWIQEKVKDNSFSPTLIFRDAVVELKKNEEIETSPDYVKNLCLNIDKMREKIKEFSEYLEKKNLINEFLDEQNKSNIIIKTKEIKST